MDYNSFMEPGTLVVGHFGSGGLQIKKTLIVGDEEFVEERQSSIKAISMSMGGKPLSTKSTPIESAKKKSKKNKYNVELISPLTFDRGEEVPDYKEPIPAYTAPAPIQLKTVTFSNAFGNIKVKVEAVLYSQRNNIMLVYPNEELQTFTPKVNETLQFSEDNINFIDVYFTGDVWTFLDSTRVIVVLYKK